MGFSFSDQDHRQEKGQSPERWCVRCSPAVRPPSLVQLRVHTLRGHKVRLCRLPGEAEYRGTWIGL